jgi:hypothetical protein
MTSGPHGPAMVRLDSRIGGTAKGFRMREWVTGAEEKTLRRLRTSQASMRRREVPLCIMEVSGVVAILTFKPSLRIALQAP